MATTSRPLSVSKRGPRVDDVPNGVDSEVYRKAKAFKEAKAAKSVQKSVQKAAATVGMKILITREHVAKVLVMLEKNIPRKKIAGEVGVSLKTVNRILSGDDMVGKVSCIPKRKGKMFCEGCNQWIDERKPCNRCERDRKLGAQYRGRSRMMRLAAPLLADDVSPEQIERKNERREEVATKFPEAFKFPKGIKWTDNVQPIRPTDDSVVEAIEMLVHCDEVRELDFFDQRYTTVVK